MGTIAEADRTCSRCEAEGSTCLVWNGAVSCIGCSTHNTDCDIALERSQDTQSTAEQTEQTEQSELDSVDPSIRDEDYVVVPCGVVGGSNASQLSRRNYIRQHCPNPNNVRFLFPHSSGTTLELWANKQILAEASPYWSDMFSSDMSEAQRSVKRRRTKTTREKEWDDSDDERDDEARRKQGPDNAAAQKKDMRLAVHQVVVKEANYTTYLVAFEWLYTNKVYFAPYPSKAPVPSLGSTVPDSLTATSSPASVYLLAHFLGLDKLAKLALREVTGAIAKGPDAASRVLFSEAALRHDVIRKEAMAGVLQWVWRRNSGEYVAEVTEHIAAAQGDKYAGIALELLAAICRNNCRARELSPVVLE